MSKSAGLTTNRFVTPVIPPAGSTTVSSFMVIWIWPTSLYFTITSPWPDEKSSVWLVEAASDCAINVPSTLTLTVPVSGLE